MKRILFSILAVIAALTPLPAQNSKHSSKEYGNALAQIKVQNSNTAAKSVADAKSYIANIVDAVNEDLPQTLPMGMLMTAVNYSHNPECVSYFIIMGDSPVSFSTFSKNLSKPEIKNSFLESFVKNEGVEDFVNALHTAGCTMKVTYYFSPDEKSVSVTFTPDEILNAWNNRNVNHNPTVQEKPQTQNNQYYSEIDESISSSKSLCPMKVDEQTTWTDVKREGNRVTYYYDVIEDGFTISQLRDVQNIIRRNLEKTFSQNALIQEFFKSLVKKNCCLIYHYKGLTTKDSFDIIFTPADLKTFVK